MPLPGSIITNFLTSVHLYRPRPQNGPSALSFPLRKVQILTRTQPSFRGSMAWGEFVPGVSVMGNAYPASGNRSQCAESSSVHNDADWDEEGDTERLTL